jgi:HEAT repeat protein
MDTSELAFEPEFSDTLEHLRSDETIDIRRLYALSALTRDGLSALAEVWPAIPPERRRHLVENLVELAEANVRVDFRRIFRLALDDPDSAVRAQAIDGLWEDEKQDLIDHFCHMLENDLSTDVRASAAQALGKYVLQAELDELDEARGEHVRVVLRDVFYDESETIEVRRRALESLAYYDDPDMREPIRLAYEHPAHKMQVSAIFAMGRSLAPFWSNIILMELANPSPEIRYEAARASGELRLEEAVSDLVDLTEDPDREIQEVAIWALGQIGGDHARRVLDYFIQSSDAGLTEAAEDAMAELLLMEGEIGLPLYDFGLEDDEIDIDELPELDEWQDLE